jgi:Type II secretion system (T2SS), protein M subtype b
MRGRVNAYLRRLGAPGVVGVGVLLACAGLWFSGLQPLQHEVAAQRAALQRVQARTPYQPAASGREADLRRFYGHFPVSTELPTELERLHRLARGAGLELAQGEYRLERPAMGLWAYRVVLPVRGSYLHLRQFLDGLLKDMPIASLDGVRFERKKAAEAQLEAQLRITLHVRPPGESP